MVCYILFHAFSSTYDLKVHRITFSDLLYLKVNDKYLWNTSEKISKQLSLKIKIGDNQHSLTHSLVPFQFPVIAISVRLLMRSKGESHLLQ